jgi:hypothetical protein
MTVRLHSMDLKGIEGRATLGDDSVVLAFDSKLALAEKQAASPNIIPLKHVLDIDFAAPTLWKPGHLRIIMRDGQERAKLHSDTFAVQLGAGRRLKEAQDFVAQLRVAVEAVEYEVPEPAEQPTAVTKQTVTFKDVVAGFREINAAYDDGKKSNASFRGIVLGGRTIWKGGKSWPASECDIVIDTGANVGSRVTATRVAAGALLAGPAGALIGSIAKKDRSTIYLTLITPDDMFIEQVSGLDEAKAREFANKVKRAGMLQAKEQAEAAKDDAARVAATTPPPPPAGVPAGWYPRGDVQEYWDGAAWTGTTAPLAQG